MNRAQKRRLVQKVRKQGVAKETAQAYAEIIGNGAGEHTPPQDIQEGQKVRLNIEAIKARKNYKIMTEAYKTFVDASAEAIFTAHVERPTLISLAEEPKWLFWSGDLIKVEE